MKDGKQTHLLVVAITGIICIFLTFAGCTENTSNVNQDKKVTEQHFIGKWTGKQIQNDIPLNVTFLENGTGMFQEISIIWNFTNTILTIGMFDGEIPSYYNYLFTEEYQTMELKNMYINETFLLSKNELIKGK